MDSPADRGRSDSKDWLRVRGRSKSVTNFKNSANYQKFLFFERASAAASKVSPRQNIRPNVSRQKSKDIGGYSQSYFGAQVSESSSESYTTPHRSSNSKPKSVQSGDGNSPQDSIRATGLRSGTGVLSGDGNTPQDTIRATSLRSGTGRASHMKFAYGRLNIDHRFGECSPKMAVTANWPKMAITATRSMPISENRSRHRSEPRHALDVDEYVQNKNPSTPEVICESLFSSPSPSINCEPHSEKQIEICTHEKHTEDRREGLEHTPIDTEATTPTLPSTNFSPSLSNTQAVPFAKASLPVRNQSLLHVMPGYFNLQSRRCISSPDVSLLPFNMQTQTTSIVISEDEGPVSPDSQVHHLTISGSPECQSDCSIDIFLSRSNSPGAYSDSPVKEDFDRCSCTSCPPSRNNLQLLSCQSPVSEPTDCCKSFSHSLSELTRQKSIASIHLTSSVSVNNVDLAREKCRKIHVIKTAHSTPILPLESSPRLVDEWLSSVVKLQRERRASDQWGFPEDDPSTYFSDLPKSGQHPTENVQTQAAPGDITVNPKFNKFESEGKQWSSTGTNTDISLNSNDVESCSSKSNSPDLLFYSNDSPNKTKPGGPISRYTRTKPLPDMCCPNCCVFHNDVQCSHVHMNTAHQQQDNVLQASSGAGKPSPSLPRHVPPLHLTSRVASNVSPSGRSFDVDGPGIMICITGEEGEATDRAASTKLPDGRLNPIKDFIGASPHYIFPSNTSGVEDDALGHFQQLSPRNSIGSICSTHSYKSSNADSAVDLGPPDDDHDFEFADFLAKHQGRRYSSVSENAEIPDLGQIGHDLPLTLGTSFSNINYPVSGVPSEVSYQRQVDSLTSIDIASPDLSYSTRPKTSSLNEDFYRFGKDSLHARATLEVLEESEAEDNLSNRRGLKCSTLLGLGTTNAPSSFRVYKSPEMVQHFYSDKFSKELFQSSLQFSNRSKDQYNRLSPKDHVLTLPSVDAIEDDALCPASGQQCVAPVKRISSNEKLYEDTEKSLHPVIPELVISDHSEPPEISPHPRPSNTDLRISQSHSDRPLFSLGDTDPDPVDADNEGLFTPISPSPVPADFDFLQVEGSPMFRSPSVSSISSEWSTCSTCTVMSDSDTEKSGIRPRKQSSWRKIRSFILWSPFIQVFKKHRYPWIQLAGHQGNFHAGEAGSVLKKLDSREQLCFVKLMSDKLKDCVPEYRGDVEKNGESYIQLQDLLCTFNHPCVMDVKMGVRTYLEDELQKARKSPALRKDMYQKMIEIDTTAPTTEENEHKAVTKPRYMQWRDEMSSSVELGFRVEGIKKSDGNSSKDFKKTKTRDNIVDILKSFVGDNETIVEKYIKRLKEIMHTQETSEFFLSHEVIGSSLLFVHDVDDNVGVWMIDFGKTEPLPNGVVINHRNTWQEGNHEDGYLFGLDNLVSIFEEVQTSLKSSAV